ncbi:antibiotic biosynthesis monooxygenase family protein [Parafrankia sp. FMc6]|uniref:antibiotic biosynthesis monooxygenase family protein n=1 Tax=Parafrankia soli TaxID=2599596 RepID=UPI0034D6DA0E
MTADGQQNTDDGAVTFVNRFTVHASPDEFERTFVDTAEFLGEQPGFLRYTLLKHVDEQNSYVNIAHWRDVESFRRAVSQPGFKPHAEALRALSTSEPNLYTLRQSFAVDS